MGIIRWVHFSDLHFRYENYDTTTLRQSLEKYIQYIGIRFQYIIITGDIFHKGEYDKDTVDFVKKLITIIDCTLENVIICPGNHDAKRSRIRKENLDAIIEQCYKENHNNLDESGSVRTHGTRIYYDGLAVRPAFWLDLNG